eukprot:m.77018 g.77018  ORF g.77018 m.77018 type:complete len:247 (+) comp50476_c0_seq1:93-833(+)
MRLLCLLVAPALVGFFSVVRAESTCSCNDGFNTKVFDCATSRVNDDGEHPTCEYICASHRGVGSCSDGKCFPASALVELEGGVHRSMADLKIGDRVRVGRSAYSDIYMFSHRDLIANLTFVRVDTASAALLLTEDHYLYVNNRLAAAKTLKVGDQVLDGDGFSMTVLAVSSQQSTGLFNPHTLHGDIVVDGILTSTYTASIAPTLAHSMLWPVRMLYTLGIDTEKDSFAQGSDVVTSLLPVGRDSY